MSLPLLDWHLFCIVATATPVETGRCAAFTPQGALEQAVRQAVRQGIHGACLAQNDAGDRWILQYRHWDDCTQAEQVETEFAEQ